MMSANNSDISVCMFGSAARMARDEISDRDVLIVYRNFDDARSEIIRWKDKGWSVAPYSRDRFLAMSNLGSLFVQHIKQEGRLLEDPDDWLSECLSRFCAKKSYKNEELEALDLLTPIERLSLEDRDISLLCDIFYVFFRHYSINKLASRGKYVFEYNSLVEECASDARLPTRVGATLHKLRRWKHAHRCGNLDLPTEDECYDVSVALSEVAGFERIGVVASDIPIRTLKTSYATLRECEAYLVQNALNVALNGNVSPFIDSLWRMIRDPRAYSWYVRTLDTRTVSEMNDVLKNFVKQRAG